MADDFSSLLGSSDTAEGAPSTVSPATHAAAQGVQKALTPDNEATQAEMDLVARWLKDYTQAREFDKAARLQYTRDRRYAAGTADPNWASDANLIGSFIDILVSFLFAQNPDAGARPAEQVGEQPNNVNTHFAETLELVISKLWKNGALKPAGKKMVRSALSVGAGWFKGTMLSQKVPAPQLEHELTSQQQMLADIMADKVELAEGDSTNPEADKLAIQEKIKGLQAKLAKKVNYGMMVDFCRAEDIQVSLDVADIADYKMAGWVSCDIYVPVDSLRERFPTLTAENCQSVAKYYQRNAPTHSEALESTLGDNAQEVGQFSRSMPNTGGAQPSGKQTEFAKIIEIWDRKAMLIRTIIDGVKTWAVEPYPPPQASKRFYSFFYLALYPVDGSRHAQSLTWRLRKLQDEYSSCRSNERTARERNLPGIIFNRGALDHDEAKKIEDGVSGEYIGLKSVDDTPLQNLFIAKPTAPFNAQIYNTEPILSDMERISGVQEALQQAASGSGQPKTATEANIQQSGFQSRTGADRDGLEDVLSDFAEYTAEVAIQECPVSWVTRVAGKNSFWLGPDDTKTPPTPGMDTEDLLDMVEVEIEAGTTGKPDALSAKSAWAQILPLLEKSLMQIRAMQASDPGLAEALINVLRETLKRLDDRLDLDEFIPKGVPTPPPPPPPEPPKMTVQIQLKGTITPEQEAEILGAEAQAHGMMPGGPPPPGGPGLPPPPGAGPGGPPPPGLAIPSHIPGTGIPMPPLSLDRPAPKAPAAPHAK